MAGLFAEPLRQAGDPGELLGDRWLVDYFLTISTFPDSGRSCFRVPDGFLDRHAESNDFTAIGGSTVFVHFRIYWGDAAGWSIDRHLFWIGSSSAWCGRIESGETGTPGELTYRLDDNTVISTLNMALATQTEYSVGALITLNDTTGQVQWYIDGVARNLDTGLDTIGSTSTIERIRLGASGVAVNDGWAQDTRVGDIYVGEEVVGQGEVWVDYRAADEEPAGSTQDWSPSAGADNSLMIDEVGGADGDSTYNETSTATDRDEIGCEAMDVGGEIKFVQPLVKIRKTGAETETIKLGVRSDTSENLDATGRAVPGTYQYIGGPLAHTDPDTAAAWDKAGVDAAELVYELAT